MNISRLLFSIEGRITRKTYWLFCGLPLFVAALYVVIRHIHFSLAEKLFLELIFVWPSIAMHTKRWHDMDKSGWWQLISAIPYLGALIAIIMCGFLKGTQGANRYGDEPLETNLFKHLQ